MLGILAELLLDRENPNAPLAQFYFLYAQGRYPEAMVAFETASLAQSGKCLELDPCDITG